MEMNITELDEWQGLTEDMVREWLKRTGWEMRTDEWGEKRWFNGNGRSIANARVLVTDGFRWIASQSDQTVQALLREINPRMRKGWPSDAAVREHAQWLAKSGATGHIICGSMAMDSDFGPCLKSGTARLDKARAAEWFFWPCDDHGSKVRWTTDAEGNML